MSPPNVRLGTATSRSIIPKGGAAKETDVIKYVEAMLTTVGINSGEFTLTIITKIKSGGSHHKGIEIKRVQRNAVYMLVQYGDNGTRFECYLSSPEYKPSALYLLLTNHKAVKAGHFVKSEVDDSGPPTVNQELEDKVAGLRKSVQRLNAARSQVASLEDSIRQAEHRLEGFRGEKKRQMEIVDDPELIKAEADLIRICGILGVIA